VDLVRPFLEFEIVGDAALERDRVVAAAAGRFVIVAVLAAAAVLDNLGGAA